MFVASGDNVGVVRVSKICKIVNICEILFTNRTPSHGTYALLTTILHPMSETGIEKLSFGLSPGFIQVDSSK